MSTLGSHVPLVGLLLLSASPPAAAPSAPPAPMAENISVVDFASNLTYNLADRPSLRRGVTTAVSIRKNLIDLVPFSMVSVSGAGATIGHLSNGTSNGTGYLAMRITVPDGAALGATVTVSVGLTDRFSFGVVNRGAVTSITKDPDPSTLQPGTAWTATVTGTDLGTPVVATIPCHTVTATSRTNASVRFTLQRSATCATSAYNFRLAGSATNDPPSWATSTGGATSFGFAYVPPPPSGVTCSSNPNLGTPVITQPTNNQVILFGSGTASPVNVKIAWSQVTQPFSVPAPNNEWIVTRKVTNKLGFSVNSSTTVTGTSISFPFTIPGTYTVSLRPKNCGEPAPSTSVTFSTRYQ